MKDVQAFPMVSGFPMGLRSKRLNPLLASDDKHKGFCMFLALIKQWRIRANGRQTEAKREANASQVGQGGACEIANLPPLIAKLLLENVNRAKDFAFIAENMPPGECRDAAI